MKKTATPRKKKASPVAKLKAELARVTAERDTYLRAVHALLDPKLKKRMLSEEEIKAQIDRSTTWEELFRELES